MPETDGGSDLLLCATLINEKVCNRRFPPLDIHIVHIGRDCVGFV
jgi:hypothetical protein